MKNKYISKLKPVLSTITLSMLCMQALALPLAPGQIHHPIRYLPGVNHLVPTGLTPREVRTAYGFDRVTSKGEGQTIAIVDAYDHPNIEHDLTVFSKQFGLRVCTTANGCFKKIYAAGTIPATNAGWAGEIALDVEWAHAIAPRAKIILVEAATANTKDLYQAIQVAVQQGANVVSLSWGAGEYEGQKVYDHIYNNPNVTFVASSGDSGTGTMHPASSPYVLSVGGTRLDIDSFGNYQGETAWSGSSGGVSSVETEPDYQQNLPIPMSNGKRGVPDVSYNGDPESGFAVYNSIPGEGGVGWEVVGGTSAGAPQWAALVAIANSSSHTIIGNKIHSILYNASQPASGFYNYIFHDVSSGTNGDCGYYCTARAGYDYVTGLGSPEAGNIINLVISTPHSEPEPEPEA